MDLLIGGITLILVVIVILSPFFQRRLFAMTVNQEEDSYIEESNSVSYTHMKLTTICSV